MRSSRVRMSSRILATTSPALESFSWDSSGRSRSHAARSASAATPPIRFAANSSTRRFHVSATFVGTLPSRIVRRSPAPPMNWIRFVPLRSCERLAIEHLRGLIGNLPNLSKHRSGDSDRTTFRSGLAYFRRHGRPHFSRTASAGRPPVACGDHSARPDLVSRWSAASAAPGWR